MGPRSQSHPSVDQEGHRLVERLGGRWGPDGGMCRCPAHDDRTPSLSVRPGRTRLLLHCFAGCDAASILRALAADDLLEPGSAIRQAVGGAREVDATGSTVREVLSDLADRFPGVRSHLLDESGDLNRFVNVYVNNEDVRLGEGMDTAVASDSTLIVLPAMAGSPP